MGPEGGGGRGGQEWGLGGQKWARFGVGGGEKRRRNEGGVGEPKKAPKVGFGPKDLSLKRNGGGWRGFGGGMDGIWGQAAKNALKMGASPSAVGSLGVCNGGGDGSHRPYGEKTPKRS